MTLDEKRRQLVELLHAAAGEFLALASNAHPATPAEADAYAADLRLSLAVNEACETYAREKIASR